MSMILVRLVIISSDKMGGRRAGYLEAALWRPRRLVELFPIIVFGVFFPKTVSKCSVTNSFIPKILNTINQNFTDLEEDINTDPLLLWNQNSRHILFYRFSDRRPVPFCCKLE